MTYSRKQITSLTIAESSEFNNTVEEGYKFCQKTAQSHYENFPVASILLTKELRNYIFPIYSFARLADDIADEEMNLTREDRLRLIDNLKAWFNSPLKFDPNQKKGEKRFNMNPIYLALKDCQVRNNLPDTLFLRLLKAFELDCDFESPKDYLELQKYCEYSANPIGEIILRLFDEAYDESIAISNQLCTGLQLVNLWQDLSVDIARNRIYIPRTILQKHNLLKDNFYYPEKADNFANLLLELIEFTEKFFIEGKRLPDLVKNKRLKTELKFTIQGGLEVLNKTRKLSADIISNRPKLNQLDYMKFVIKNLFQ